MNSLKIDSMILIGATSRNIGKTSLAMELIDALVHRYDVIGLKVTIIKRGHTGCPRGENGCGVCTSLRGNYEIEIEKDNTRSKDTSKMLSAGAKKVYWIRVYEDFVIEAIHKFYELISIKTVIICESNSIRKYVLPGLFIMLDTETPQKQKKKSALDVIDKANIVLINNNVDSLVHYKPHPTIIKEVLHMIEKLNLQLTNKIYLK